MASPRKPARKAIPTRRTTAKPAAKNTTTRSASKTPAKSAPRAATQTGQKLLPVAKISQPAVKPAGNPQSIVALAKKVRADLGDTEVHVLAVPYEARQLASHFGAKWHKDLRCHIYPGPVLPAELAFYASEPYSWERWIEDQINGKIKPVPAVAKPMVPRPHQQEAIDKIRSAGAQGLRGFIAADETGLGKTISSLLGVAAVASLRGHTRKNPAKLLIMCPKSVIPHWRNTIRASGVDNLRVTIINYDQALKLVTQPEVAQKAKTQRTAHTRQINNGGPNVKWDLVILDEVHKLKNASNRSKAADVITRAGAAASDAPFVMYTSATIGQTPLELRYLASLVAQLTGRKTLTGKTWGAWLEAQGYAVKKGSSGEYSWVSQRSNTGEAEAERVAGLQQRDTQRMSELLFGPKTPSIRRSPTDIAGWPEIQRIPYPVELQPTGMGLYRQMWESFRSELRLLPRGHNPKAGVVIQLRFRQKASLLLIDDTFEQIEDLLENGYQVAVSAQFIESVDQLREKLRKAGIASEEFSGRQSSVERENARLRFQRGEVPVIFFTVTEGISLHAGEQLPDGSHANMKPRATIVHDIRYSSLEMLQIEGRAHRDGQAANIYYMVAEGTVQEPILALMLRRMNNLQRMSGDMKVEADEATEVNSILERGL